MRLSKIYYFYPPNNDEVENDKNEMIPLFFSRFFIWKCLLGVGKEFNSLINFNKVLNDSSM